ncbi:ABC transporter substrate-binding protein [Streptomyces chartreusis]|uniref:ABC transporter substrate-binding protein n=1 Tax=Streptomyces chartreusis TaxID=1969 RepID=UPI0036661360
MKRTTFPALVAMAAVAGLAACSSTSSTSSAGSAPGPSALADASGVTDITIWHGLSSANGAAFQRAIADFNAANRGKIHVTAAYQGVYADLLAKYTAAIRSGSTPTVILAGDVATGFLTDVKRSIPAAEMAKANPEDLKLNDLSKQATNYYKVRGVQQAVPMNVSTPMLWVNQEILKRAGLANAPLNTLDDVVAAAKAIKEKTGVAGFTMQDDDWYIEQLVANAGQEFCTPENGRGGSPATSITINTGGAKADITKIANLYTSHVALTGGPDGAAAISAFQAGKVGMMLYSSGILGALKQGTTFDYRALPFPTSGRAGESGPVIGGSALWLSSTAKPAQQVAAWKLVTYLTSPKVQEKFSHATGYVPINIKTADSRTQQAYLAANPMAQTFARQLNETPVVSATAGCVSGAMQAIKDSNIKQLQAAYAGQKSIGEALDDAVGEAEGAFQRYQDQLGN